MNARWMLTWFAGLSAAGCAAPNAQDPSSLAGPNRFMGLADDQQTLIREEAPQSALASLPKVTAVEVRPYEAYEQARKAGNILRQERHGPWVYWAIEESRDCPFPNGSSAWYLFTQRCKSLVPGAGTLPADPPAASTRPGTAASAAVVVTEAKQKDDQVQVLAEGSRTVVSIRSPRGIGSAAVQRAGEAWPDPLVLRLHLRGLESLQLDCGDEGLNVSVLSHGGHDVSLHAATGPQQAKVVRKGDALHTEVRAWNAPAVPAKGLSGENGYFEMVVPQALLKEETLKLHWIDFYRL